MSANHIDCRYMIRGDWVPVAGTQYTMYVLTVFGIPQCIMFVNKQEINTE